LPACLALRQSLFGGIHERGAVEHRLGQLGDADTRRDAALELAAGDLCQRLDLRADALGDGAGATRMRPERVCGVVGHIVVATQRRAWHQHGKARAAMTGGNIDVRMTILHDRRGDVAQHLVAARAPELVIERAKFVDVEQEH
jgi:hypothetical protein